jgi:hypothetical protein
MLVVVVDLHIMDEEELVDDKDRLVVPTEN